MNIIKNKRGYEIFGFNVTSDFIIGNGGIFEHPFSSLDKKIGGELMGGTIINAEKLFNNLGIHFDILSVWEDNDNDNSDGYFTIICNFGITNKIEQFGHKFIVNVNYTNGEFCDSDSDWNDASIISTGITYNVNDDDSNFYKAIVSYDNDNDGNITYEMIRSFEQNKSYLNIKPTISVGYNTNSNDKYLSVILSKKIIGFDLNVGYRHDTENDGDNIVRMWITY